VLDQYLRGFHTGDPEAVQSACLPELSKRGVAPAFWGFARQSLEELSWERLAIAGKVYVGDGRFDDTTPRRVRVLDVAGNIAAAELIGGDWMDFAHLVRFRDGWRIADLAWWADVPRPEWAGSRDDVAAVRSVLEEYVAAVRAADVAAVERVTHPAFRMRSPEVRGDTEYLHPLGRRETAFLEGVAGSARDARAGVFQVWSNDAWGMIAAGFIRAESWTGYVHLLRIEGEWRIVNALWTGTPSR